MDLRTALRVAIKAKLDTVLSPFGVTVVYRPTRQPIKLPAVTMYDTGTKIDDTVPLYDRKFHLDVWTDSDLDQGETFAHAINSALDHQALILPNQEGLVAFLMLLSDLDTVQNDADLSRKSLVYRMLVYEYNGPEPFVLNDLMAPRSGSIVTGGQTPVVG